MRSLDWLRSRITAVPRRQVNHTLGTDTSICRVPRGTAGLEHLTWKSNRVALRHLTLTWIGQGQGQPYLVLHNLKPNCRGAQMVEWDLLFPRGTTSRLSWIYTDLYGEQALKFLCSAFPTCHALYMTWVVHTHNSLSLFHWELPDWRNSLSPQNSSVCQHGNSGVQSCSQAVDIMDQKKTQLKCHTFQRTARISTKWTVGFCTHCQSTGHFLIAIHLRLPWKRYLVFLPYRNSVVSQIYFYIKQNQTRGKQ